MKKYYFLTVFAVVSFLSGMPVRAQSSCPPTKSVSTDAADVLDSFYFPKEMIGSCAYREHKSKIASWRDNVAAQIKGFVKQNFTAKIQEGVSALEPVVESGAEAEDPKGVDGLAFATSKKERKRLNAEARDAEKKKQQKEKDDQLKVTAVRSKAENEIAKKIQSEATQKRLAEIVAQKTCVNGVSFSFHPVDGLLTEDVAKGEDDTRKKSGERLQEKIAAEENDVDNENSALTVCSAPVDMDNPLVTVDNSVHYDIPKTSFFSDNKAELEPEKLKAVMDDITGKLTADPACPLIVKSIQIETSANQLANTANYDRWDFAKLSGDRAKYMERMLQEKLKGLEDQKQVTVASYAFPAHLDSSGTNGNGTSGSYCPYKGEQVIVKGDARVKIVKKEIDDAGRKDLDASKYARVNIETERGPNCKAPDDDLEPKHPYAASACFTIQVSCGI